MDTFQAFPLPSREQLASRFVGQKLQDMPVPSAVLDVSKIKRNCKLMLDAAKELEVGFRAHVKTHKTLELTRFQLGSDSKDVRLISSTIVELEALEPLLKEYKDKGAAVDVLYGIPVGSSSIARLASFVQRMGPGTLTLLIDNETQLDTVAQIYDLTKSTIRVFIKTDSGYHRAGLAPTSSPMQSLVNKTLKMETESQIHLLGFYSHNSLSYGGSSPQEAMDNLRAEVDACTEAALTNTPASYISSRTTPLQISSGASPTALSIQNLLPSSVDTANSTSATDLRISLAKAKSANIHFEIHAGVYPVFDMQQVSASSRSLSQFSTGLPEDSIALSILAEVLSTYPDRTENPEVLVSAGCIALAREPCKSYRGHGVVTPWNMPADYDAYGLANRIIVDRVSQEHALLQWEDRGAKKQELPFTYGQKLRIWPNHACITGSQYGWYLIVDGESEDENLVRDVWVRWRGW